MKRRNFLGGLVPLALLYWLMPWARAGGSRARTKVAFGSCNEQDRPQPIWSSIAACGPELFVFCGDNVYADTEDMIAMRAAYDRLANNPDYDSFRKQIPVAATWDDHDYGGDDVGREYPMKRESKQILLDFFEEPKESPRRERDGVYTSYLLGEPGRSTQIILLDLRWWKSRGGPLLGEPQWAWLEEELKKPAEVRLLVSSSQFATRGSPWDKWDDHPHDKARFLRLVDELDLKNLVVLSGDMHFGELSRETTPEGIELIDFTSSGLNRWESADGISNSNRFALYDRGENFGLVDIEWGSDPLQVNLELRDLRGKPVLKHILYFKAGLYTS